MPFKRIFKSIIISLILFNLSNFFDKVKFLPSMYFHYIIYCTYALNMYCQDLKTTGLALLMLHVLRAKSVSNLCQFNSLS